MKDNSVSLNLVMYLPRSLLKTIFIFICQTCESRQYLRQLQKRLQLKGRETCIYSQRHFIIPRQSFGPITEVARNLHLQSAPLHHPSAVSWALN
jgi:hypothetical protein